MSMATIKNVAMKGLFVLKKYSPQILTVTGALAATGGAIWACKATLHAEEILDEVNEKIDAVHEAEELASEGKAEYTSEQKTKDLVNIYVNAGWRFVKLYAGPAALFVFGMGSMFGGAHILSKRNIAIMSAYKTVDESYKKYRDRVTKELGKDKDYEFAHGIEKEKTHTVTVEDEEGKKHKETVVQKKADKKKLGRYAVVFDESAREWEKNADYNLTFVKMTENHMNDRLRAHGHLFLNDVRVALGFDPIPAGQIVGWLYNDEHQSYVDFGLYDLNDPAKLAFLNGFERSVILDFNVDGVIYDKL